MQISTSIPTAGCSPFFGDRVLWFPSAEAANRSYRSSRTRDYDGVVKRPLLPIVVMTGWGTVDLAVEAMRRGVRDFVQKPWENSRLLQTLNKQVKHARARRSFQRRLTLTQKTEAKLQRELVEARELQENLLANSSTAIEGLHVATEWQPATTVGGDYIAAFNIDDEHAGLCVADVVGKGLPAALLMANFQTL